MTSATYLDGYNYLDDDAGAGAAPGSPERWAWANRVAIGMVADSRDVPMSALHVMNMEHCGYFVP